MNREFVLGPPCSNLTMTKANQERKVEPHFIQASGGDAKAAPDEETEDPIMKAEREFFEIIKKVRVLGQG